MKLKKINWNESYKVSITTIMLIGIIIGLCLILIYYTGYTDAVNDLTKPSFWEQINMVSYSAYIKFLLLLIAIGYCIGKILHG